MKDVCVLLITKIIFYCKNVCLKVKKIYGTLVRGGEGYFSTELTFLFLKKLPPIKFLVYFYTKMHDWEERMKNKKYRSLKMFPYHINSKIL